MKTLYEHLIKQHVKKIGSDTFFDICAELSKFIFDNKLNINETQFITIGFYGENNKGYSLTFWGDYIIYKDKRYNYDEIKLSLKQEINNSIDDSINKYTPQMAGTLILFQTYDSTIIRTIKNITSKIFEKTFDNETIVVAWLTSMDNAVKLLKYIKINII